MVHAVVPNTSPMRALVVRETGGSFAASTFRDRSPARAKFWCGSMRAA